MSSELLWREYPTDQRGTFFRQFWDTSVALSADTASNHLLQTLAGHTDQVSRVVWSPDGRTLASSSRDQSIGAPGV